MLWAFNQTTVKLFVRLIRVAAVDDLRSLRIWVLAVTVQAILHLEDPRSRRIAERMKQAI